MDPLTGFNHPLNVLVTGASQGLGLALVRALVAVPHTNLIYACARTPHTALELAELAMAHPQKIRVLLLDVTSTAHFELAVRTVQHETDRLHVVINAAGVLHAPQLQPERRIEELSPANMLTSYTVNTVGPAMAARYFLPLLTHDQRAVFASISARVGSISDNRLGGWYSYRAAKAAQNQITRTFAVEARRRAPKLVVVALHPGTVDTRTSAPFNANVPAQKLFTPDFSASNLLNIINGLAVGQSGQFIAWDGQQIPW